MDESGNKVPDLAKAGVALPSLVSVVVAGKRTLLAHARLQLLRSCRSSGPYAGPSGQLGPGAKSKNRLGPRTWAAGLPQQRPRRFRNESNHLRKSSDDTDKISPYFPYPEVYTPEQQARLGALAATLRGHFHELWSAVLVQMLLLHMLACIGLESAAHSTSLSKCIQLALARRCGRVGQQGSRSGRGGRSSTVSCVSCCSWQAHVAGACEAAAPPKLCGAIGPAWTRGEIEKPAGTKNMGSWTAAAATSTFPQ